MANPPLRTLVDVNIYIDALVNRQPFAKDANALMYANDKGRFTAYVAAFSFPTMFYLLRRELIRTMPQAQATILKVSQVCTTERVVLEQALRVGGDDYEDNLQLACALAYNLDAIITRDKKLRNPAIPFSHQRNFCGASAAKRPIISFAPTPTYMVQ